MDQQMMRDRARELLEQGEIKYLFGYESCDFGSKTRPVMITSPDEVDKLIFTPLCKNNLAVYLTLEPPLKKGEKVGLIAKGCDGRALTQVISENGIQREALVILGVPCQGIIDPYRLHAKISEAQIEEARVKGEEFIITTSSGDQTFGRDELVFTECMACPFPTPKDVDHLLGAAVQGRPPPVIDDPFKTMNHPDRWAYWSGKFEDCIRCYACRQVCSLCFCEECAADSLRPNWVRRSVNVSENAAWHILRAFHMAGRCAGCGECQRACPVDIPLHTLNRLLGMEARRLYDHVAGVDPEAKPLLGTFELDDEEAFIL